MMRVWVTAAILALGAFVAGGPASAQQQRQAAPPPQQQQGGFRNPLSDLLKLFTPAPQPPPQQVQKPPPRKRPASPPPMVITDNPTEPRPDPTVFIVVAGDTLSELLAGGLAEAYEANPDVQVLRKGRSSSGLVRDDYYDWRKALRDMVSSGEKVTHVVMMVGSNDRQQIKDATTGATLEPFTDAWREAYGNRVEEIASILAERNIPLFWVGMPPMQNGRMSADMLALNEIVRGRLAKSRATYVDIWEAFTDPQNRFAMVGPSLTGETVKLRAGDGVNFTKAGARMAAHFVEIELKRALDRAPPTPVFAMPADPTADPASQDPALQPGGIERLIDEQVRRGLDGLPPLPVVIPTKAVAGPILPLNAPETSPGGTLLSGRPQRGTTEAGRLIERVLVDGRLPDSKPGRADDFRWPK